MALYVNTNVSSLNAQRKLSNATLNLNTSYQRLSSGLRINSAKDDAAGLMISNRLTAQINGLNQGNRNANDGIAVAQTVEGALDETTSMLQRIRTLAVQAANGTNTDEDRKSLQDEVTQLCEEIFRISQKTTFGGAQVLDGKYIPPTGDGIPNPLPKPPINLLDDKGQMRFQVGSNAYDNLSLDLSSSFKLSAMYIAKGATVGVAVSQASTDPNPINPTNAPGIIAADVYPDNATDPQKNQVNKNFWDAVNACATENSNFTGLIQTTASTRYENTTTDSIAIPGSTARFTITTQALAQRTLDTIDTMIQYVDSKRSALGALQNRMESTIRNQASISENESDARSRIRDTDFAAETAALTQNNIIQNASQSILTQANQRPSVALQLLGQ